MRSRKFKVLYMVKSDCYKCALRTESYVLSVGDSRQSYCPLRKSMPFTETQTQSKLMG